MTGAPNTLTMIVRLSGALSDFVAANVGERGDCQDAEEYVRDLIRRDMERKEAEAFERLKAELTNARAAPESSYHPLTAIDFEARQRDVQRWLGRCMVRLQQYERLLKAIVAENDISGPAYALESIRAQRITDIGSKTLGTLVGQFLGTHVVTHGADTSASILGDIPNDVAAFGMRMHVSLSAEDHARASDDLKELVLLRNQLVHHFLEQHNLWTLEGCDSAHAALVTAYARIDQGFTQLQRWAKHMLEAREQLAEFVSSDAFRDWIINGIAPDGAVIWPMAGIVSALREASRELAVNGWTSVAAARQWIGQRQPDQQPAKYGCASWKHVLHESGLFELRYREVDGRRAAWYRAFMQ